VPLCTPGPDRVVTSPKLATFPPDAANPARIARQDSKNDVLEVVRGSTDCLFAQRSGVPKPHGEHQVGALLGPNSANDSDDSPSMTGPNKHVLPSGILEGHAGRAPREIVLASERELLKEMAVL
jgi:hypothetical protein